MVGFTQGQFTIQESNNRLSLCAVIESGLISPELGFIALEINYAGGTARGSYV